MEDAILRIEKYKNIAGFMDYPDDFVIREMDVKMSFFRKKQKIKFVYFLQHEYSIGVADFVTEIGAFSSYFGALKAQIKAMCSDKFKKYPKGFTIDKCEINEDNWTEGFVEYPINEADC